MHVLLMGLRGSGKTTVGGLLAHQLGSEFIDLDDRVLATFEQATVTDVWAAHGEQAWRAAESRLLRELLGRTDVRDCVIALGGGTPTIDSARGDIQAARTAGTATVVYLRCVVEELHRRLAGRTEDRPTLTGADPVQETAAVMTAREPVFRSLADHEYDVSTVSPQQAAASLGQLLGF
jgi:shikimate kinase